MKRILSLVLSTLLLLTLIPISAVAEELDGADSSVLFDGTYTDIADYAALVSAVEAGNGTLSGAIRLTGDIDLGGAQLTTEIATLADGTVIDGNGKTLKNFTMSATEADLGLFAVASGATVTVKNLNIGTGEEGGAIAFELTPASEAMSFGVIAATVAEGAALSLTDVDVYANITWKSGKYNNTNCAGFVGLVNGNVAFNNCSMNGSVSFKCGTGQWPNVAGFVGLAGDTAELAFYTCENNARIDAQQRSAGFVSKTSAKAITLVKCKNNGDVSGCYTVAGFVADMTPTASSTEYTISHCINNGNVSGEKYLAGGFVANAEFLDKTAKLLIEYSVNAGNVSAKTAKTTTLGQSMGTGTGGFIGTARANKADGVQVEYSVNTGDVTNTADMVGGIIGSVFCKSVPFAFNIENTVNAGRVSGGCYTGGLVGGFFKWNKLSLVACLSIGDVTSNGGYVGPFIGAHQDIVSSGVNFENNDYYTYSGGGGYFCELHNGVDGGEDDPTKIHIGTANKSTTPITEYSTANDALYIAGNVCKVGSFSYDTETEEFTFTAYPEAPRFVGVQLSGEYTNAYSDFVKNVRFVAVLDNADISVYNSIGFKLTAVAADGTESKLNDITGTEVYNSILANTDNSIKEYTAEQLGGEYIFALAIEGAPAVGSISFNVTAYATALNGSELCDLCTYNVQLVDGACTSVSLVMD